MSGIQEETKRYLNKIEDVLKDKPDYFRGFINYMNDSSLRTKYVYLTRMVLFMEWTNKDITELRFDDFNNYLSTVTYKEDGSKKTSSYLIGIYASLKKFCEYLYASRSIPEDYMQHIKRPKAKESQETIMKRSKGYLDERELKKYIRNVKYPTTPQGHRIQDEEWDKRDKAIIYTFLFTGIRSSALRLLDVSDINLKKQTLIVTEKGEKVRVYDIPEKLCDALEDWLDCREEIMKDSSSTALFVTSRRGRISAGTIAEIVKRYADCVPDKNITPHKLRATYGTQLYNKTGDIYFVQQCMGHSSPETTELYIREKKQDTKRASNIMDKLI